MIILRILFAVALIPGLACAQDQLPEMHDYLPTMLGDWMASAVSPPGVLRIGTVSQGPALWAGWTDGDMITEVAGRRIFSTAEMCLARDTVARLAIPTVTRIHLGKSVISYLVGIDLNHGSMGADHMVMANELPIPAAMRLNVPVGFPARAKAQIAASLAKNPSSVWVKCLLDTWVAARDHTPPPAAVPQPNAFLESLIHRWRHLATIPPGVPSDPAATVNDAAFALLYDPYPALDAPVGTLNLVPEATDVLNKFLKGKADKGDLWAAALTLNAQCKTNTTETYLKTICISLLDPERNSGWPMCHIVVSNESNRKQTVAELAQMAQAPGANHQLLALAGIAPAVMDRRWEDLASNLRVIGKDSPWLAVHAIGIAASTTTYYGGGEEVRRIIREAAPTFTGNTRRLVDLAGAGRLSGTDVAKQQIGGDDIRVDLESIVAGWEDGDLYREIAKDNRQLGVGLFDLTQLALTHPEFYDEEGSWLIARQGVMCAKGIMSPMSAQLVAMAASTEDHFDVAIAWESVAQLLWRGDQKQATQAADLLGLFRDNQRFHQTETDKGPEVSRAGQTGITLHGKELNGLAEGRWTGTDDKGHQRIEMWQHKGEPAGRYRILDATDKELVRGLILNGSRIGWYRITTSDGGVADGWYDGRDDGHGGRRTGWWCIYDQHHALIASGLCKNGEPVGHWRRPDGSLVANAALLLPADPPSPTHLAESTF